MKLSKPLLQAIVIGVSLGAASSCSFIDDSVEIRPAPVEETIDKQVEEYIMIDINKIVS